jgi:hypothetical protein
MSERVKPRGTGSARDTESVQHWIKYVATKYVRIERTAIRFAENEVLRSGMRRVLQGESPNPTPLSGLGPHKQ